VFSYGGECARECGVTLVANLKKLAASKLAATRNRESSRPFNQPPGPPRSGCVQQIAAGNAGWRLQFVEKSLVAGCHRSRVPELWTLGYFSVHPMNTIPEPDNYSQKEVYAFFGLAASSAQVLEKGLVNMVVTFKTFGLPITRADFDVIFDSHDSRTLGQLLRAARDQHIPIPDDTDKLLTQALEKRNYLNHDFFADHAGHFMTESGRRTMIQRLRDLTLLFEGADRLCVPIYRPLLEQRGISEETLKKQADELIERAKNDQAA
jgi:hypothetical protein